MVTVKVVADALITVGDQVKTGVQDAPPSSTVVSIMSLIVKLKVELRLEKSNSKTNGSVFDAFATICAGATRVKKLVIMAITAAAAALRMFEVLETMAKRYEAGNCVGGVLTHEPQLLT